MNHPDEEEQTTSGAEAPATADAEGAPAAAAADAPAAADAADEAPIADAAVPEPADEAAPAVDAAHKASGDVPASDVASAAAAAPTAPASAPAAPAAATSFVARPPAGGGADRGERRGPGSDRDSGSAGGGRYFGRRKVCIFCVDKAKSVDYKDPAKLRRFVSDRGRIEGRRRTGVCAKHQRWLAVALKRARHLALLPYSPEHIRSSGAFPSRR